MTDLTTAARKAADWTKKRNALIRRDILAGRPLRAIARDVGLSHAAVAKIRDAGEKVAG